MKKEKKIDNKENCIYLNSICKYIHSLIIFIPGTTTVNFKAEMIKIKSK